MNRFSIRVRLTLWYSLSLLVILCGFAIGARTAMVVGTNRAVDAELSVHAAAIGAFLSTEAPQLQPAEISDELQEMTQDGTILLIKRQDGTVVFKSPEWRISHLRSILFETGQMNNSTIRSGKRLDRVAVERIQAGTNTYSVVLARPLREYQKALEQFQLGLVLLTPFMLALAALGGYWLSSRALSPVTGIITEARTIDVQNLSARLHPPPAQDELRDLTETINAMFGRIQRSVEQIQQFTADASHELRAPLTLIRTAADYSLRRPRSQEELTDALQKILRESERMSRLVDSLLLLSRTEAGTYALNLAPHDLVSILRQALEQVRPLSIERSTVVEAVLPDHPLYISADEDSLERVAFILLDNAIKYTHDAGRVTLKAGLSGERVWFSVSDDGIGIAPEHLSKVFDRFWRADQVRSRGKGGLGVGLSIAQNIVEKHSGQIRVTSTPGSGSTFTVELAAVVLPDS